jgi:hypothetical protein
MRIALVFMLATALPRIGRPQIATFLCKSMTNYALHLSPVLSPAGTALLLKTESIADGVDGPACVVSLASQDIVLPRGAMRLHGGQAHARRHAAVAIDVRRDWAEQRRIRCGRGAAG